MNGGLNSHLPEFVTPTSYVCAHTHAIILLVSRATVGSYVGHKAKEISTC